MRDSNTVEGLEDLLNTLGQASSGRDQVPVGTMLEFVGQTSFGPMLLVAGLIAVSPISGVPGVPTLVATVVLLTATQLLLGRKHLWLPRWIRRRTVGKESLSRTLKRLAPIARLVDRVFRPRLSALTGRTGASAVALLCLAIALVMPPMELVPFSATTAGAALSAFGLALTARDGVMTLVALGLTIAAVALVLILAV